MEADIGESNNKYEKNVEQDEKIDLWESER